MTVDGTVEMPAKLATRATAAAMHLETPAIPAMVAMPVELAAVELAAVAVVELAAVAPEEVPVSPRQDVVLWTGGGKARLVPTLDLVSPNARIGEACRTAMVMQHHAPGVVAAGLRRVVVTAAVLEVPRPVAAAAPQRRATRRCSRGVRLRRRAMLAMHATLATAAAVRVAADRRVLRAAVRPLGDHRHRGGASRCRPRRIAGGGRARLALVGHDPGP